MTIEDELKRGRPVRKNPGYMTFSHALGRLRYVRTGLDWRGEPRGEHRWQAGDRASVHLKAPGLAWTLAEVELVELVEAREYEVEVLRFDGVATTLGGVSIGDRFRAGDRHFFAMWTAQESREDGEGTQKVYEEGSMRPPPRPVPRPWRPSAGRGGPERKQ